MQDEIDLGIVKDLEIAPSVIYDKNAGKNKIVTRFRFTTEAPSGVILKLMALQLKGVPINAALAPLQAQFSEAGMAPMTLDQYINPEKKEGKK